MKILTTSWPGTWNNKNPFDPSSLPYIGGAEIQIKLLSLAIAKFSHVAYVNLGITDNYYQEVRLYTRRRSSNSNDIVSSYRELFLKTIMEYKPDIVLSYLIYPVSDFIISILEKIPLNKKILFGSVVGSWEWKDEGFIKDKPCLIPRDMLGSALNKNHFFFTRSKALNIEIMKRSNALCKFLRPIIHIQKKTNVIESNNILCFGRLAHPKRFDLIIEAFHWGMEHNIFNHNTKLIIIGDGPLRKLLEKQVSKLPDVTKLHINFLGVLDHITIFEILNHSRLSIHASSSEGYGTAPTESVLHNIPTVLAGFPEIVMDLKDTKGIFTCNLELNDMIIAIKKAWECPEFDSTNFNKLYSSNSIGKNACDFLQQLL